MTEDSLIILDCTVRDGNYSVEFKFSEADTALLTSELSRVGVKWIEVGHGVGLGAMDAGMGRMPAGDFEMIRAARDAAGDSKVGAFYIPSIAPSTDLLKQAREAGLDFVRIGENAPEASNAYAYLEAARNEGMIPCLNLMKTYGITPQRFGAIVREATHAGAAVVYCVDSAGSMLAADVAAYTDAGVDAGGQVGFHSHNNLMMAVSNSLVAYDHGARHIDTTLCGLGRSAGNAPTEILVAALERRGIETGVDLFGMMDLIDQIMWPLVGGRRPNDMLAVAAGYAQFHSSFLPEVAAAARRHNAELRRLLFKVATHNPMGLDRDYLDQAAAELEGTATSSTLGSATLVAFDAGATGGQTLNVSMRTVRALVDGLTATASKRTRTLPVLHLVPTEAAVGDDLLLGEFVLEDDQVVMGRVTFGSRRVLDEVLDLSAEIALFLVTQESAWLPDPAAVVSEVVGAERVIPVRESTIRRAFLVEAVDWTAQIAGCQDSLLIYGGSEDAAELSTYFSPAFQKVVTVNDSGWADPARPYDIIVGLSNPAEFDLQHLTDSLSERGRFLSFLPFASPKLGQVLGERFVWVDMNQAYSGTVGQYLRLRGTVGTSSIDGPMAP